ncbi:MAG: ABC transporter ATP-binding protein [Lachnospiraceae bacterium]|nr:ABC transporter ATP-binding protein [Lachnospiraceae bacterium]
MKDKKGNIKVFFRFLGLLGQALPIFLFAMIIHMVGDNFLYLTLAYFVDRLTDMALAGSAVGLAGLVSGCVAANLIALAVFFVFGALYDIYAKRGNAIVQRMMIDKLLKLPMAYFDRHHTGEIVTKLMSDADTASQIFTSRLRRVTTPLMSVIVYMIPMVLFCPQLAACLVLLNLLSLVVHTRYIPAMKAIGRETSWAKSRLIQNFMDVVNGRDTMHVYSGGKLLLERHGTANEQNAGIGRLYWGKVAALGSWNTLFDMIFAVGFLVVSVFFIERGWCSVGEVAAIYTLYGTFSYNFLELGKYIPELINCIARAEIVFEFMEEPEEERGGGMEAADHVEQTDAVWDFGYDKRAKASGRTGCAAGNIVFRDVSFGYGDHRILHHCNAEFQGNQSTAVTGQTGIGKSTLLKLLLKFYMPQEGQIFIGNRDIAQIDTETLRSQIAYVPQDTWLFHETIRENIRYGNPEADDAKIIEAAKAANAHDFICKLPEGYNTVLRDGGSILSGGERQRIALARAFVREAPILLLDEATSALDNQNETQIQAAITKLITDKTALVVAHSKLTIKSCVQRFQFPNMVE